MTDQAELFLDKLGKKPRNKILYNFDKSRYTLDPTLFKKLTKEVWEFRARYGKQQYRFLAFWDKSDVSNTLVIVTHGTLKKSQKMPAVEIEKALKIREDYFNKYRSTK